MFEQSEIASVGILGAGLMGAAVAAAHMQCGFPVVLCDLDEPILSGAAAAIAARNHGAAAPDMRLLRTTVDPAEAAQCDLVLEAIVESLTVKQRLYGLLRSHVSSRTILASNTSTIPIERLAEDVPDASRFCGLHFLHPVDRRPLVEVVRGPRTDARTVAAVTAHVGRLKKTPLVVRDGPGFVVNRLLFPHLGEALELLREGVPLEEIERAAVEFGMAFGPLRLLDEIGLDTALHAGWVLASAFPDRIVSSPILVSMLKSGRRGRKSWSGFFAYSPAGENVVATTDAGADAVIARWIAAPSRPTPRQFLGFRMIVPMLLEATRILDEEKVDDASDIDRAVLLGLGFPTATGGLLRWADALGPTCILDLLASTCPPEPRFQPTPRLLDMAQRGERFYPASIP